MTSPSPVMPTVIAPENVAVKRVIDDYPVILAPLGEDVEEKCIRDKDTDTGAEILAAHDSILKFTQFTFPQYKADEFHRNVAGYLDQVVRGEIKHLMLFAPPQHGKECAHDTPVLTTAGWKTHGELRPGDYVFGANGQPAKVIALSTETYAIREVEFMDGTIIRCHPRHEWPVYDRTKNSQYRNKIFIYETEEMLEEGVWYGARGKRGNRGKFQVNAPRIVGSKQSLPLDPYILGVWLGDGASSNGSITHHSDDIAVIEKIERSGIERTATNTHPTTGVIRSSFRELHGLLKQNNLHNNKHIPDIYYVSSIAQRLELLAGLVDSDGYIYPKNGRVTFSCADPTLVRDVGRLISTFGWRVTKSWFEPVTSSSGIVGKKPVCQVTFNPDLPIPTSLERKQNGESKPQQRRRSIKEIRHCEPVPGRCIQVDGGIYLVGDTLIPTHNSELVSTRLPSYWLAHNPELPVALVSYGASLAYRNSRAARSVFESHQYKLVFPGRERDTANWRMHDWHILDDKGYVLAVGVGGPITGHGFGLGIIDDPIENWAAGQSEALRERAWQWWQGTFKTRMWENSRTVVMLTRWHDDDMAGRILRQEGRIEQGGKWTVISYPALADHKEGLDTLGRKPGDPLAPSRFSKEFLLELRDDLGPHVWSAEYQQKPTKPEGDLFKIGRIQLVNSVPIEIAEVVLPEANDRFPEPFPIIRQVFRGSRAWDLAGSTKKTQKQDPDYTVGILIAIFEGNVYILDMVREQMTPDQAEQMVKITAGTDGKRVRVRVEKEPGQSGIYQVNNYIKMLMGWDVEGVSATGDKMVRASPLASQVNAGNVFMLRAVWNKFALNELAGFPNAAHDDIVDSAAYAFNDQAIGDVWVSMSFKSL